MKQIIVVVAFFSLMACKKDPVVPPPTPAPTPRPDTIKKPDTTPIIKKAGLVIAQFTDGKKVFDYAYNDSGRIIKINHYNNEVGALDTIEGVADVEYNAQGFITKISSHEPNSTFVNYIEEFTYDTKNDITTHKRQYYDSREAKYKLEDNWVRTNVIYDAKGRITLIEAERQRNTDTIKEKQAYIYDTADNIIESTTSYFDEINGKFVIGENMKIDYYQDVLTPTALFFDAPYPLKKAKKLVKKLVIDDKYSLQTAKITILEKDKNGNPTKIQTQSSEVDKMGGGSTSETSIVVLMYK